MPAPIAEREFKEIPLGLIDDPELPSRTTMDDEAMDDLVRSIRANGLLQPMMVFRTGERFQIIAGHRRLIACKRAGMAVAPAMIYPSKEQGHIALQYAENRFREDLNPADEALLFAELLERNAGSDTDTLAAQLNETRAYVEGRLLLLRDGEILEALRSGKLQKIGVAQELFKVDDPRMRRYYLDAAIRGGATLSVVRGWVQDYRNQLALRSGEEAPAADVAPLSAVPTMSYFTCAVCLGTDNVHTMQPVNVHAACKTAILDKLLASYRGES